VDVAALAMTVAAVLAPLLAKGAEKFAEEFGQDAYEKSKALLDRVRSRLKGKPKIERALVNCERSPDSESQTALAEAIQGELVTSPELVPELTSLVQELTALMQAAAAAGPKYQVAAKIVGAVGDGSQAIFHLGKDALKD